jgi:leucyl/phenylalanyl-tRNA--protein transferase
MPVFRLTEELIFPPPELADDDGLLAVGGDLRVERLLLAYSMGIFPWYSDGDPILWWSPSPRPILLPEELKVSRSLRQTIKKGIYTITMNRAFEGVIRSCSSIRRSQDEGTWITDEMIDAYIRLHKAGYALSVEAWDGDELAGGLYGVILGKAFFGESMFAKKSDASKVAFVKLAERLKQLGFELIDCQVTTTHLARFGAREVPRPEFINRLKRALRASDKDNTRIEL